MYDCSTLCLPLLLLVALNEPSDTTHCHTCHGCDYVSINYSSALPFVSCPLFTQALKCSLYGLNQIDVDQEKRTVIINRLIEMVEDKTLIAQVPTTPTRPHRPRVTCPCKALFPDQVVLVEADVPHIVLTDTSAEDDVEINGELGRLLDEDRLKVALPLVSIASPI